MPGKTINVSNATQLLAAARLAKSGDTILLASGDYGIVNLSGLRPTGLVTIKSANPNAEASFYKLGVTNSSNILLQDINVSHPIKPGDAVVSALTVNKSDNITLVGLNVSGSLDGNSFNDGAGLILTDSHHVTVLDSTFRQLNVAVTISRASDLIFAGNTVTEAREGMNVQQATHALFERNYITNMQPNYAAGDHPDMFQVQSGNGAGASSDLIFRSNVMIEGTSGPIGGIFIRSENVGNGVRQSNIVIENNFYQGTYRHAISVSNSDNVVIDNNTVLASDKTGVQPAIITFDDRKVLISDNIATLILDDRSQPSTGISLSNNVAVWNTQSKSGLAVSALFAGTAGGLDLGRLDPLAGSIADKAGAGFHAVTGIGNLAGSVAAQLATYLPMLDQPFAPHFA